MKMSNSYADHMKTWEELTTAVEANPELAHLEPQRALLEVELEAFKDANVRQANLKMQAQETTLALQDHFERGRDLATRLRDGIRCTYGRTAEQLVQFRMQPRRPRTSTAPSAPENAKPSGKGPTPTRTVASETDATTQE